MKTAKEVTLPFSLRHFFIDTPQAVRALTRLAEVHGDTKRTGSSKGLVIQGPSGVGKSTMIREYAQQLKATEC